MSASITSQTQKSATDILADTLSDLMDQRLVARAGGLFAHAAGVTRFKCQCIVVNSAGPNQLWLSPLQLRDSKIMEVTDGTSLEFVDFWKPHGRDLLVAVDDLAGIRDLLRPSLAQLGRMRYSPPRDDRQRRCGGVAAGRRHAGSLFLRHPAHGPDS